jgi:hypothetical protein
MRTVNLSRHWPLGHSFAFEAYDPPTALKVVSDKRSCGSVHSDHRRATVNISNDHTDALYSWFQTKSRQEGIDSARAKLSRKLQHFTRLFAPDGPFHQAPIFFETVNVPNPLCAGGTCYYHYIRYVTRSHTPANCELDPFQQTPLAPLILKPLDWNFG